MKTGTLRNAAIPPTAFSLVLAVLAGWNASATSITYVGTQAANGTTNWSSAGVTKTWSVAGSNNKYGTAGYYQICPSTGSPGGVAVGNGNDLGASGQLSGSTSQVSKPAFISSLTGYAGTLVNYGGYPKFLLPDGSTLYNQGALSVSLSSTGTDPSGSQKYGNTFTFTLGQAASFRLGMAVDAVANGSYAPNYVSVYNSTVGANVFNTTALSQNGTPKMVFFDIIGNANDTFVIAQWRASGTGPSAMSLITFDALPTPGVPVAWVGASTAWDTTTAGNWKRVSDGGACLYTNAPSMVYFDDTATGTTVDISTADVTPYGVTFTNNSLNYVLQGSKALAGTTGLALLGTGQVTLSNVNTFTGSTTITNGALVIGGAGQLGGGSYAGAIANSGAFIYNSSANQTLSGVISGAGTLTKTNIGTLTLSRASSSFTGNLTITGGALIASAGNNMVNPGVSPLGNPQTAGRQIVVGSGATLTFSANDALGNSTSTPQVALAVNGGTVNNSGTFFDTFGPVTLNAGTLNSVGGVNATFPSFQFNGPVTVGGSAPSTISGSGANSQMSVGYGAATTFNVADATGDSGSDLNVSVVLQNAAGNGTNGLTKTGAGTMTLSAVNTYTGTTTVSNGILVVAATGSIDTSAKVLVQSGATLDVTALAGAGGWNRNSSQTLGGSGTVAGNVNANSGAILSPGHTNAGTLTLNGNLTLSGDTERFDLTTPGVVGGGTNDLMIVNGDLTIYPTTTFNFVFPGSGLPVAGTYTLYQFTGALNGDASYLSAPGILGRCSAAFALDTSSSPKRVLLTITGSAQNLLWTGQNSSDWDTATANWTNRATLLPDVFQSLDLVLFNDSGNNASPINLTAQLLPGSVTVSNVAKDYIFAGGGYFSGSGALLKQGPGRLTLQTYNDYSGGTTISGGAVEIASDQGLGSDAGGVTLDGGTLAVTTGYTVALGHALALSTNNGTLDIPASAVLSTTGAIAGPNAALTKIGDGEWDITGGPLNLGALTVSGGTVGVTAATAFAGPLTLTNSTLQVTGSGSFASNALVLVQNGGTLNLDRNDTFNDMAHSAAQLTINSGGLVMNGSLANRGYNAFSLLNLNGGELRVTGTANATVATGAKFQAYGLKSAVNVGGAQPSLISNPGSLANAAINVGDTNDLAQTVFAVADVTGDAAVDLTVGAELRNNSVFLTSGWVAHSNGIVKAGAGTMLLTAANSYTGPTTISNGLLRVDGSLGSTPVTVVGGALGGTGVISGPVVVQAGGTLAPGDSIGSLFISNSLTLLPGSFTSVELDQSSATSDQVLGLTNLTYGGTLLVTNLAGTLTTNDTFKLFDSLAYAGSFAGILPATPGTGLQWDTSTLTTDGTLRIALASTIATNPTNITLTVSGHTLNLTWPADHLGWLLQSNSVSLTVPAAWYDIASTATATNYSYTLDPTRKNVFYRLRKP